MKTIDIAKATGSLAHYAKRAQKGPIILTSKGQPVAVLVPIDERDLESISLSKNPDFLAILERSWAKYQAEGGISIGEVRKRLGIKKSA
jgi:prevent-host-death family protein